MHKKLSAAKKKRTLEKLLLRRLEQGGYGICSDCDKPIPQARLRAVPEATRCVHCQHEREQRSAA